MPTTAGTGSPDGWQRDRLRLASVGRLATVRPDGTPHIVPITFAIAGEVLVTAVDAKPKTTTNLQRLRNLRENPAVSLLVDHYDEDWAALWWVRVDGTAEIVDRDAALIDALVQKYPQYRRNAPAGPLIVVRPTRWTAWSST